MAKKLSYQWSSGAFNFSSLLTPPSSPLVLFTLFFLFSLSFVSVPSPSNPSSWNHEKYCAISWRGEGEEGRERGREGVREGDTHEQVHVFDKK